MHSNGSRLKTSRSKANFQEEVVDIFKHILVAVDGSEHSKQAVLAAVEIAKKFDSDIFVLHVREHETGRAGAYPLETPSDATGVVSSTVSVINQAGVPASGQVVGGSAGHTPKHILDAAVSHESDSIVMGSRGLSDIASLLLGSVTHKVIQLAHIPVLVVRPSEAGAGKERLAAAAAQEK
jgi:nucleotide-binding universal stress UspA family protein